MNKYRLCIAQGNMAMFLRRWQIQFGSDSHRLAEHRLLRLAELALFLAHE